MLLEKINNTRNKRAQTVN